ncbi:MAG TPA: adenosylcobinamide-GDP ribazoletransferase, partial [Dehalococcoidales bacterium]|nr:adenosylcobinamide-GDP ribazoletransferase [Dehalococcoidales bacterium]
MTFLSALQFLTSIPVYIRKKLEPKQIGQATMWFPLIGFGIGMVLALINWILAHFLPTSVVNILLIVTLVIMTGALHLDGFADTCDGIAGHKPVEERWKVMHDSRTGAFGVVGIALLLLVKYVALNNIPNTWLIPTLIIMPAVSRFAMVYALFAFPYARPEGLGMVYKQETRWPQFTLAVVTVALVGAILYPVISYAGFILIGVVLVLTTL